MPARKLTERQENRLLEEYRVNVDLWKHDDLLRQSRTTNFLTINTILLVALSAFISIGQSLVGVALTGVLFSIFGMAISWIWRAVMVRNSAYVLFRRFQLRSIESHLPGMTTFENVYNVFYKNVEVAFDGIDETFSAPPRGKISSTLLENRLPTIISWFWVTVLLAGIIVLFASLIMGVNFQI
jgi:hypothetical protein